MPEGFRLERSAFAAAVLERWAGHPVLRAARDALTPGGALYLVGGAVRDVFLGRPSQDLDLVFESKIDTAVGLAERLAQGLRLEGLDVQAMAQPGFDNARLVVSGLRVDLVRARAERYPHPAARPKIRPAGLREDLLRRDFAINALAVPFADLRTGRGPGQLGPQLIDPADGLCDLHERRLRTMHERSFWDDPSRIVRAARFQTRLAFELASDDRERIPQAIEAVRPFLPEAHRLRDEFLLVLREPFPGEVFRILSLWGALGLYGFEGPTEPFLAALLELDAMRLDGVSVSHETYAIVVQALRGTHAFTDLPWSQRVRRSAERVLAAHTVHHVVQLDENEVWACIALEPVRRETILRARANPPRILRGTDVLALGVPPGPMLGRVLEGVRLAREQGVLEDFQAELALARRLLECFGDDTTCDTTFEDNA